MDPTPLFVLPDTFFVGKERCRLPQSLLLSDLMKHIPGAQRSVSLRAGGRFVISCIGGDTGGMTEDDVVEIADYDPVRHSVLAIGLREPCPDTPIHWLAYRTHQTAGAVAFVWDFVKRPGVRYVNLKHPFGTFKEAMELLSLAKAGFGPAGIEGRGYLVIAAEAGALEAEVKKIQGGETG